MSLLGTIRADLFEKRKETTDKVAISLLTTLYSEAANVGINDGKRESTDAEVVKVVTKFIKGLNECIDIGSNKGIDTSGYELEKAILQKYIPTQLSEAELEANIAHLIQEGSNKGQIMKFLKEKFNGQYDGKMATNIIDRLSA